MESDNNNNTKTRIFRIEAINFSKRLQLFVRDYVSTLNTTKPIRFNKPILSLIDGELRQMDGLIHTEKGFVKPIVYGWEETETPSILVLDTNSLVKIADILNLNEWYYDGEKTK